MIPVVGITIDRRNIVVRDPGSRHAQYLRRDNWESFSSRHEQWALIQDTVLQMAQLLGWSQ